MSNIAILNFTGVYFKGKFVNIGFYESFSDAFRKSGHNVMNYITNEIICDPWNGFNISISKKIDCEFERSIRKFNPDLIISFNNSKNNIVDKLDCPIVVWEADTPQYYSDKNSLKKNADRYHFIYASLNAPKQLSNFFKVKKKNMFFIDNATSVKPKKINKIHDISFIGTLYDKNNDKSAIERKKILLSLKDCDFKIYTNNIPNSYKILSDNISDQILFDKAQTQKLMNQSFISLNHSHLQSLNNSYSWRVLDILGSNSLLISEESNLLIKKFGRNIKKQFYFSHHDVRKKCNYFLKNKNLMRDLISEQNEIIDKNFRWESRVKEIESIFQLKKSLPINQVAKIYYVKRKFYNDEQLYKTIKNIYIVIFFLKKSIQKYILFSYKFFTVLMEFLILKNHFSKSTFGTNKSTFGKKIKKISLLIRIIFFIKIVHLKNKKLFGS
jgi:hypothetical protein